SSASRKADTDRLQMVRRGGYSGFGAGRWASGFTKMTIAVTPGRRGGFDARRQDRRGIRQDHRDAGVAWGGRPLRQDGDHDRDERDLPRAEGNRPRNVRGL